MNLATALRKKNELVAQIAKLEKRIVAAINYTEDNKIYSKLDYDEMCQKLQNLRHDLLDMKYNIDMANHKMQNGKCIYNLIIKRSELKAEYVHILTLREKVNSNRVNDWNNDSPKLMHYEDAKSLDEKCDIIEKMLHSVEDDIAILNGSINM